jgi:hypothetical protein
MRARVGAAARLRGRETLLRVSQHKLHLFARHAGETLQKIIHPRAGFEILEECPDRHARAFEHAAVGVTAGARVGFADEQRIGLLGTTRRVWGRRGVKVRQRLQLRYE